VGHCLRVGLGVGFIVATVLSQSANSPTFEVASVKPISESEIVSSRSSKGHPGSTGYEWSERPGSVTYTGATLTALIARAYKVRKYQITGPTWLDTELYNVVAKIPDGLSSEEIPAMLQNLLADRFMLVVHWETKEMRVYGLVAAKGGLHLKKADTAHHEISFGREGQAEFIGYTLAEFADILTKFSDRPVLDMTEVQGTFDISTTLDPALRSQNLLDEDRAQALVEAARQTGLKLELRTVTIRNLVIDRAEKTPREN
jgi:uncharacterized protein (TIGR03435 family)